MANDLAFIDVLYIFQMSEDIILGSMYIADDIKCFFKRSIFADIAKIKSMEEYELESSNMHFEFLLDYWQTSISEEAEEFWIQIKDKGIVIPRRNVLKSALEHGKFPSIEQEIEARNNWARLKCNAEVKKRFSQSEILELEFIILNLDEAHSSYLRRCYQKLQIPKSQLRKFAKASVFMDHCNLWHEYFTAEEKNVIVNLKVAVPIK